MAAAANTSTTATAAVSLSPKSPSMTASPPWSQIVRGPESKPETGPIPGPITVTDSVPTPAVDTLVENNAVAPVSRKPVAWNKKPISTEVNGGDGGVMRVDLWPSLSDCTTKNSPKQSSSFDDSGSSQVAGVDMSSSTTVLLPLRSPSSTSQKLTTSNSNHYSNSNHARPARQKSMKRDGGSSAQANGVFPNQSSQQTGEGAHHHHNHGSPKPISGGSSENSGRDNVQTNNRESGQRHGSGEQPHQRNPFRKGNGGPHSRGDGSHQNYGGRRNDQERGNHDFNHQRSFNGRDASMQPRGVPRGFVRPPPPPPPPPVTAPFVISSPMQPFMNSILPVYFGSGVQFVPPIPPIYFPPPGHELYLELLKQIDYYFSNDNLVRDTFLRKQMDENGWISVGVIAGFNRIKKLTNDTYQILEAIRLSTVIEVQGDKMRRREDWRKWLLPDNVQIPTLSGSRSPRSPGVSGVTNHLQIASLDPSSNVRDQVEGSGSSLQASSGDSNNASRTGIDETGPSGC